MQVSYSEILARSTGPESYADRGNTLGVVTAGYNQAQLLSSETRVNPNADTVEAVEGNTFAVAIGETASGSAESEI